MMAADKNLAFRAMLVKISRLLSEEDINSLKTMCKDDIGMRELEQIGMDPRKLFDSLEVRGKLKSNDMSYLKLLIQASCTAESQILPVIEEYERKHIASGVSEDHSGLARYLSQNIGKNYKMVLRILGLKDNELDRLEADNPRNCEEVIYHGVLKCFRYSRLTSTQDVIEKLENGGYKGFACQIKEEHLKDL